MPYTKETWVDGTTAITAARLQNIEDGIEDAHAGDVDNPVYVGKAENSGSAAPPSPGPSGWTVTRTGTGKYTVTHNLNTLDYVVLVTPETVDSLGGAYYATVRQRQLNAFLVETFTTGGTLTNTDFTFMLATTS